MNTRNIIILIAVLILIAGGFSYYFFVIGKPNPGPEISPEKEAELENQATNTATSNQEEDTVFSLDQETAQSLRQKNLSLAQEKAAEWQKDAVLYQVTYRIASDYKIGNGTETYIFGSPAAPDQWWTFTISENSSQFARALIPKSDYAGNIPAAAAIDFWKTSYIEALQIAEKNGGEKFRSKNPSSKIEITLTTAEPKNWLWWLVDYKSSGGETLRVQIDPNKGEVLNSDSGANKNTTSEETGEIEEIKNGVSNP